MASTIAVTLYSTLSFGSFHVVKNTLVMLGNDVFHILHATETNFNGVAVKDLV